ncbi:MAG: sulfotransferase, partial [Gammaproteobacteria bacterium]
ERQDPQAIEEARRWLKAHASWSTQRLFAYLAEKVAPRVTIEKSPSTVMKMAFLKRLQRDFPEARILHLTRHPRATCRSIHAIVKKTDEIRGFKRNIDPEHLWRQAHGHIMAFLRDWPSDRWMRIRGEDLLAEPDRYLPQIAQWLGLRMDEGAIEAMKHPEHSPYASLGPYNAPFGNDPGFLHHPYYTKRLPSRETMAGPMEWGAPRFSRETLSLARSLGYG